MEGGEKDYINCKKSHFVLKPMTGVVSVLPLYTMSVPKKRGLYAKLKEKEQLLYSALNDPYCPVESLRLYLSKLNPQDPLSFQRPRTGKNVLNEPIWYCNKRIGENKIAGFMKEISKAGQTE